MAIATKSESNTSEKIDHDCLQRQDFVRRHIGPTDTEISEMLGSLGLNSLDELIDSTVPSDILIERDLVLPTATPEQEMLQKLQSLADSNQSFKSFIGMGYYGTHVPNVIARNLLENPGWYTAYTPYQAEISQGRLESLLNFQQMVMDLTAMEVANASLLDEGTAAAEAMALAHRVNKKRCQNFFLSPTMSIRTLWKLFGHERNTLDLKS